MLALISSYYPDAFARSFWAALSWVVGQGVMLTLLIAAGGIVFELVLVFVWRRNDAEAKRDWRRYTLETIRALAGGCVLAALILFVWFFIQDAPTQIRIRDERIAELGGAPDVPVNVRNLLPADTAAAGSALRELSDVFNKDIAEICGERLRRIRLCVQNARMRPLSDCAAKALEQFQSERPIEETLLGTSRDTGLLNAGEPEIVQILNQAVQRKDRQILIDFDSYSLKLYSAFRFLGLIDNQSDEKQRLFEPAINIVDGDLNHWESAASRYCEFIQKTNERISMMKTQITR